MYKTLLLFLIIIVSPIFASDTTATTIESINDLFTHGGISISSSPKIGDLLIAIFTGIITYGLLIFAFLIAIIRTINKLNGVSTGNSPERKINAETIIKVAQTPLLILIGTLIVLNGLNLLFHLWNLDIFNQLKFFLEARYDILIDNLDISPKMKPFAETLLVILDLSSKFVFWSMAFIYIFIVLIMIIFVISIIITYTHEHTIYKKMFTALGTTLMFIIVLNIYSLFINATFFKNSPNIPDIGIVSDIKQANKQVIKYYAKKGLGE